MRIIILVVSLVLGVLQLHAQDPVLVLEAPVGGVTYYTSRDTIVNIRWSGIDDTIAVQLDYTIDNGRNWVMIEDSAKGLSYDWNIKGLAPSTNYRIRVVQLRPAGVYDNIIYSGHSSPVADAWWAPDNDRVVSVAGEAHIWDSHVSSNTPLGTLPTGRAAYYGVRWSSDSNRIVTCADENVVKVVDVVANTIAQSITHPNVVTKIELDPTGNWLFTKCDDNRTRVYNLPGTTPQAVHNAGAPMDDMVINGDGTRVVTCAIEARVYGRKTGLPNSFTKHSIGVLSAAFSPDGSKVCTIGGDATIRLWDQLTAVEAWTATVKPEGVRSVAFSPDGSTIAVGMSDSTITLWDAKNGASKGTIGGFGGAIRMVAFSPDGNMIAGASDDNFARVYDAVTLNRINSFQHGNDVNVVRWSERGDRILTTSRDGTARVWQVMPVILTADTSDAFAIAPPPPSFVRFTASGDTVNIRETTTIHFRTEGSQYINLADIDSVELRISYDASMLLRMSTSIPSTAVLNETVTDAKGVRRMREVMFFRIPLDSVDKELFTITLQATLGQDSVTYMSFDRITQIGKGPGTRIDKRSEPILVRGICRIGDGPRLYNPLGDPLMITGGIVPQGIRVHGTLSESAPATLEVFDLLGRCVWMDRTTASEESSRAFDRIIPDALFSGVCVAVVRSDSQRATTIIAGGAR